MRLCSYFGALGAAVATVLVVAGLAGAAPIQDAQFVHFTLQDNGSPPVFFLDSAFGSPNPSFLPSANCGFDPARNEAQLTADVRGWESPVLPPEETGTRDVSLHARVHGTVADKAGNVYRLAGSFHESGVTQFPFYLVAFDGSGPLTLTGPGGVVSGDAEFVDVTAGPPEWDFYFTHISACNIR